MKYDVKNSTEKKANKEPFDACKDSLGNYIFFFAHNKTFFVSVNFIVWQSLSGMNCIGQLGHCGSMYHKLATLLFVSC